MEDFIKSLEQWVNSQKNALIATKNMLNEDPNKLDRVDLILESRIAFQHIIKTLDAFDKWLQEPFILRYMPKDLLIDVRNTILNVLAQVLELDIRHTSEFKKEIAELYAKGQIEPVFFAPAMFAFQHQERQRRGLM